ncbi:hypothetical protein SD71_21645 [Cohnella kolymensis]|uniref:DUF695 domain-containing protein n=1 Tax=Cohnella kolymensis TaxID=1590652 RepID=A0ABR4ZZJ3_9BACL|nr:DUF695 domain-containing protein [Cohnella kolymensis]KIL34241.1 hypothetical protein SD71_21645 [Cohnella kolymensis]
MSDHWDIYLSKNKTIVRVDLGIIQDVPISGANALVKVNMISRGFFSKKLDIELVGTAEDEMDSQLTNHDFLVGAITCADSKSFYIYTMHEKILVNMLNKILSKYRKLECEISIAEDPKWEFYLNNLYPDAFEKQWMIDRKVVEQLQSNNDNLQIPREISHWLYFVDNKSREDFKRNLNLNIFRIVEEKNLQDDSEFPLQLIISHTSTVEFETIYQITTELLKKTIDFGGNYDGWESPVIESK